MPDEEIHIEIAASGCRPPLELIETLADEMTRHLLTRFPLRRVQLELRKFDLPVDTLRGGADRARAGFQPVTTGFSAN